MQTLIPAELRRRVVPTTQEPNQSLLPGSNRHPSRYRRAALIQLRQGGGAGARRGAESVRPSGRAVARPVSSAGLEPASSGISDRSLYQLEYEHFVTSSRKFLFCRLPCVVEPLARIERATSSVRETRSGLLSYKGM